jgi:hypothetical protein
MRDKAAVRCTRTNVGFREYQLEMGQMALKKELIPDEWKPDLSRPHEERYDWRLPNETIPTTDAGVR